MKGINSCLIKEPKNPEKSSFFWNLLGSLTYAVMSVGLLMIVTNVLGEDIAGVFSIAFTTSQLLLTIGLFEIRSFQITDQCEKYHFSDYLYARGAVTLCMVVAGIIYALIRADGTTKCMIIILLCLYRVPETIGDILEGYYQQTDRLYVGGRIFTVRTLVSAVLFIVVLFLSKDLLLACFALTLSAFLLFFLLQGGLYASPFKQQTAKWIRIKGIIIDCFPLFIGNFLLTYLLNAPKYAIDASLPSKMQTYFNVILMPAYTINLMSSFIFKPYLVSMSKTWAQGKIVEFRRTIIKVMLCIAGITLFTMGIGYVIGLPVLKVLYHLPQIMIYRKEFEVILLGGGLNAAGVFLYFILTIMRKQHFILAGYIAAFLAALISSPRLVQDFGITGAAFSYLLNLLLLFLLFFIFTWMGMRRKEQ